MERFIDLHMHSYYSDDGEFLPKELIDKCFDNGIKVMAIADHNCIRANAEGKKYAEERGIKYIPAIEIDCVFEGVNLHVLGYGIDYESEDFKNIENNIEKQSLSASKQMLLATQKLGFSVTDKDMEELEKDNYWKGRWTGEMFAEVLLNKSEYSNHPLLEPYRAGNSRGDNPYVNFYWDFYSQGKPCYTKINYPSLEEIIRIIHRNKGKAILAHPGVNLKNRPELLFSIIKLGIDGIEAFSSYHSDEDIYHFYEEAKKNNLITTCGSDYHGKTKPAISVGGTKCTEDEKVIEEMLKKAELI
ncbi:MAG: PHP domain-containing protein [Clostridium sp.]|nr:PHP domain-containing protein [Clostridium sp.]